MTATAAMNQCIFKQLESSSGDGDGRNDEDDIVVARWPCSIKKYPQPHEPNSWWHIKDVAMTTGHLITLAGRYSQSHPDRSPKLTLRGPRVREVFREVCRMTRAAGISTDCVRVVFGTTDDPLAATHWSPHWEKEQVSAIESSDELEFFEDEDDQQDCLVSCIWRTTLGGAPWGPMRPDGSHGTPWGSLHGAPWGNLGEGSQIHITTHIGMQPSQVHNACSFTPQ